MRLINWALNVIVAMLMMMTFFFFGPIIESKFWPVYSRFTAVEVKDVPERGVSATFQFTKLRNCDPQGYAWYNGELGNSFRQLNIRSIPQVTRRSPLGTQLTSPIVLEGVTVPELTTSVFAIVYSRCHPLWISESLVYP